MNKAKLYRQLLIDVLLVSAAVNKNNLYPSWLSMLVLTKMYNLKDVTNFFASGSFISQESHKRSRYSYLTLTYTQYLLMHLYMYGRGHKKLNIS